MLTAQQLDAYLKVAIAHRVSHLKLGDLDCIIQLPPAEVKSESDLKGKKPTLGDRPGLLQPLQDFPFEVEN